VILAQERNLFGIFCVTQFFESLNPQRNLPTVLLFNRWEKLGTITAAVTHNK